VGEEDGVDWKNPWCLPLFMVYERDGTGRLQLAGKY